MKLLEHSFMVIGLTALCRKIKKLGAYYLQAQDALAIFLHNDFICCDTCSVTGGRVHKVLRGGGTIESVEGP